MNKRKPYQRLLAMGLAFVMALGAMPVSVSAYAATENGGEIIAFEELSEETANREVPLGTSLKDLDLPDTLNATVRVATPTDAEKLEKDSGEPQFEDKGSSVPVEWASDSDYDSDTADTYTFTAKVTDDSYTVSVALPTITVTVLEDSTPPPAQVGEITAFDPLDEDIAEQSHPIGTPLSALVLPKTLDATVSGASVFVPVTWKSTPEYNPGSENEEPGEYLFTPQVGKGFSLADGVIASAITVSTFAPWGRGLMNEGASVDITNKTVTEIKNAIETVLQTESTVTVIGSKTNVSETLILSIPDEKTVVWTATFEGNPYFLIRLTGDGTFEVAAGGNLSCNGNNQSTILAEGENSKVAVTGGTVSMNGDNSQAIYLQGENSTMTVSDGVVSGSIIAIRLVGENSTLAVSGGEVSVTDSASLVIFSEGENSMVTVSGGVVFAKAKTIASMMIITNNDGLSITGTGVVIAWDSTANNRSYPMCSTQDIHSSPENTAYWYNDSEGAGGIAYKNDENEGFIPLTNVTVTKKILTNNELVFSIPTGHIYSGSPQGIGAVTYSGSDTVTSDTGGIVTVKYNGSTTVPQDAGTYAVTADISGGTEYEAASIELGDYTISPRPITLTADDQTVIKGGSLPTLTYTVGNLAPSETALDALSAVPTLDCPTFNGNALGNYPITLSGGTADDNHTITDRTDGNLTVAEQTYTVTFNLNGGIRTGGGELTQTVSEGSAAAAPTATRNNYTFAGWDKAFTNVQSNLTVTAQWSYNGGGGGNGGGSSSGGSSSSTTTPATTTPGKTPNQPVTAAAPVTATAGQNGAASASIPEKSVTDAIAKAQADAKAQGKTANGISVVLNVTMPKGATSLTATLTRTSLNSLVSAGVTSLELNGSPVTVSFDKKALVEIQKQSSGNISITIVPNAKLSASAKTMIGARPVYDLTVSYTKDGKNATVSSFGGGTATVSVPYTPAKGEAIGGLYAVYVDASGNATRIAGSAYDANSGCVIFTTTHFSLYGIGYTAPSAKFTDMKTHWAKESIDYVVGRRLLSGTTETTFAPDTAMTRGMLVTALGRLANVDAKAYATNSFTDVTLGSAFQPYIEWAYKKGIVQGTGNGKFEPNRAITRQEIAVIFANFAKATGYTLPVTRNATTYADASSIGSAYKTAVTAMQQAGIMMGGTSNKFNPKSSATRAEVSSMLHRYIKLTIDPATAQGWAKNDDGQYLYYKDGKALTGTQTIDSVKYFFNTDGTLKTSWVKDDAGNWRFYSGNTMLVGFWDLGANGNNKTYYFNKDSIMVAGKWLEIEGKWYYLNADGSLAKSTKIDDYEVDENGVRKTK